MATDRLYRHCARLALRADTENGIEASYSAALVAEALMFNLFKGTLPMRCLRPPIAALCLATLSVPSIAQTLPNVAAMRAIPAGKWAVNFDDRQCVLERPYTVDGKSALFALNMEPVTHTAWLRLGIVDKSGPRDDGDAVMTVDGMRIDGTLHYNIFSSTTHRVREYMLDLRRHELGNVKQAIRFWTARSGDVEIDTASFPAAWSAMRRCMDDLHIKLGIQPAALARVATPPVGSPHDFIDHPHADGPIDFAFLYWVTENGRVDDCKLLVPSGIAKFDAALCASLIAKGRFKPARDAQGKAIRAPGYEYARLRTATVTKPSP